MWTGLALSIQASTAILRNENQGMEKDENLLITLCNIRELFKSSATSAVKDRLSMTKEGKNHLSLALSLESTSLTMKRSTEESAATMNLQNIPLL